MTNVCIRVTIAQVRLQTISTTRDVSWGPFMVSVFTEHAALGGACNIVSSRGHVNEVVQWVALFPLSITLLRSVPLLHLAAVLFSF